MELNREVYSRTEKSMDSWETPDYFFKLLDNQFNFTLDPCATPGNTKCKKYFTKKQDGLKQDWQGEKVFVNPPFSQINDKKDRKGWVWKCYNEGIKENTLVVMILPPRTDTKYWHNYIMKANEIWFCKGRVNFLKNGKKPKKGATFPLAIVIFESENHNFPSIKYFYHKEKDLMRKNQKRLDLYAESRI